MKFVVNYSLPYRHNVSVAIEADSKEEAEQNVEEAFDEGRIGLDVSGMDVIYDEFDEDGDRGDVLEFKADLVDAFPADDASVRAMREDALARRCLERIRSAHKTGPNGLRFLDLNVLTEVAGMVDVADGQTPVTTQVDVGTCAH